MKLLASAPGRICLFGEHMDWCRRSVIPVAVDMRIFMLLKDATGDIVRVDSHPPFTLHDQFDLRDFDPTGGDDLRYVRAVCRAMMNAGHRLPGCNIRLAKCGEVSRLTGEKGIVDLPAGRGLSSSAAVCVAAAGALGTLANGIVEERKEFVPLTKIADIAYTAERKILGVNCGQMDQYASALGNVLYMDCTTEPATPTFLRPNTILPLVIGDTKQSKDTPMILAWLGERFAQRERLFMDGMTEIVSIVEEAKHELTKENPDLERIGELMNLNQHYLKDYLRVSGDCPVSPNGLDLLIEVSLSAGALGAKLSGSGGGGAMVALCRPQDVDSVAEAIRKKGGEAFVTVVAKEGLSLRDLTSCA